MNSVTDLKVFSIGFDEDGYYCEESSDSLGTFKYRGYLCSGGLCSIEQNDIEEVWDEFVADDDWLEDEGAEELDKFKEGCKKFLDLKSKFGGHILGWAVEYDNCWVLLYSDNNVGFTEEEIQLWLDREVDDSDFD